jgi:vesicle coat complex subunit
MRFFWRYLRGLIYYISSILESALNLVFSAFFISYRLDFAIHVFDRFTKIFLPVKQKDLMDNLTKDEKYAQALDLMLKNLRQ